MEPWLLVGCGLSLRVSPGGKVVLTIFGLSGSVADCLCGQDQDWVYATLVGSSSQVTGEDLLEFGYLSWALLGEMIERLSACQVWLPPP